MKQQYGTQNELKKWIKLSQNLGSFEDFLMVSVQGLGRLSLQLDEIDKKIVQDLINSEKTTIKSSIKLTNTFTLSYLWVLGAYEVIRTVWGLAKIEYEKGVLDEKAFKKITETKKYFTKIRIPLAKMQPWRNKKGYSPIAYPILDTRRGIAWHIAQNEFISRKELAEVFLNLADVDMNLEKPQF